MAKSSPVIASARRTAIRGGTLAADRTLVPCIRRARITYARSQRQIRGSAAGEPRTPVRRRTSGRPSEAALGKLIAQDAHSPRADAVDREQLRGRRPCEIVHTVCSRWRPAPASRRGRWRAETQSRSRREETSCGLTSPARSGRRRPGRRDPSPAPRRAARATGTRRAAGRSRARRRSRRLRRVTAAARRRWSCRRWP